MKNKTAVMAHLAAMSCAASQFSMNESEGIDHNFNNKNSLLFTQPLYENFIHSKVEPHPQKKVRKAPSNYTAPKQKTETKKK
jgi:hypothetical protein